jgi:hypothetical protein
LRIRTLRLALTKFSRLAGARILGQYNSGAPNASKSFPTLSWRMPSPAEIDALEAKVSFEQRNRMNWALQSNSPRGKPTSHEHLNNLNTGTG